MPPPVFFACLAAFLTGALCGCRAAGPARTPPPAEYLSSAATRASSLPFSDAVRAGEFLFVSGQIGAIPGTLVPVPGGIRAEARQALENVSAILKRNGSSLEDVVKCTVFLADMKEWPDFNGVYREFFTRHLPARSALGASGLALGARVEVECLAYVPSPAR